VHSWSRFASSNWISQWRPPTTIKHEQRQAGRGRVLTDCYERARERESDGNEINEQSITASKVAATTRDQYLCELLQCTSRLCNRSDGFITSITLIEHQLCINRRRYASTRALQPPRWMALLMSCCVCVRIRSAAHRTVTANTFSTLSENCSRKTTRP